MAKRKRPTRGTTPAESAPAPAAAPTPRAQRAAAPDAPDGLKAELATWRGLLTEKRELLPALLVTLIVGAVLRFFQLTEADLWQDELAILWDAKAGSFNIVSRAHIVHLKIIGWFLGVFGENAFALRAWGALTGSLAAPALVVAGRWCWPSDPEKGHAMAWIWGLFGALAPYLIYYSQDGNYYGAMSFLVSLQVVLFVAFFRGAPLFSGVGILVLGLVSHYNHPFASLFTGVALGLCFLGSLIDPALRRQLYTLNPAHFAQKPAVPILIILVVAGFPVFKRIAQTDLKQVGSLIELGSTLRNIEFGFPFFAQLYTAFGATPHRPGLWAGLVTVLVKALVTVGVVYLAWRALKGPRRIALPLLLLLTLVPLVSFLLIFNMTAFRNFYLRYFTYQVPLFFGTATWGCLALGTWKGSWRSNRAFLAAGLVLAAWVPLHARYYAADFTNYEGLAEYVEEHHQPGEEILIPIELDWFQAKHYLGALDPPRWPNDTEIIRGRPDLPMMGRSALIHRLYGKDSVWFLNSWRQGILAPIIEELGAGLPIAFEGRAKGGWEEDARLYHWDFGQRVLLPYAATRFSLEGQDARVFAAAPGRWDLLDRATSGTLELRTEDSAAITLAETLRGEIEARPRFPERLLVPPSQVALYADDLRLWEETFDPDEIPVVRRRFNGPFTYLLWAPPGEERQLVLRALSRPEEPLVLEVAVDGVHQGLWSIPAGEAALHRIPTDIRLEPGRNHLIDIHGMPLRAVPDADVEAMWSWAGLEWNAGEREPVEASLETLGRATFAQLAAPLIPWGARGATELPRGSLVLNDAYPREVSDDLTGPSGQPALVFDIAATPKEKLGAYQFIFAPPARVQPGQLFAFSTYLRTTDSETHEAALAKVFFGANGNPVAGPLLGNQQKQTAALGGMWRRFVDVSVVPQGAVAASPGVIIFPPDPKLTKAQGSVAVDAIADLGRADGPYALPGLDEGLLWAE